MLMYHHKIDPRIFDDVIPWEKEMYLHLMAREIEEENLRTKLMEANKNARKNSGR